MGVSCCAPAVSIFIHNVNLISYCFVLLLFRFCSRFHYFDTNEEVVVWLPRCFLKRQRSEAESDHWRPRDSR